MARKKEWLEYILVYIGPKGSHDVQLMATDFGMGMRITVPAVTRTLEASKWRLARYFKQYVHPCTRRVFTSQVQEITRLCAEKGAVWVTPKGLTCTGKSERGIV